jgi:hypothetical protein
MKLLDHDALRQLLAEAADVITGDWLLVGGAAMALWLRTERTTEDIDLIGLGDRTGTRRQLLDFAYQRGLPVEMLNSAADYFVTRIEGWNDGMELLVEGRSARIYRPSATVLMLTKLSRGSEQDLLDCHSIVDHVEAAGEAVDADRVVAALDRLSEPANRGLEALRTGLRERLRGLG